MLLFMVFVYTLLLLAIFYFIRMFYITVSNYIKMSKLPGPPGSNIMAGNLSYFRAAPEIIFQKLRESGRKFYPIYKISGVLHGAVNLLNPKDCELIMSNPVHNDKGMFYNLLRMWLKDGLLTSTGNKWQTRRKILTPAFHFSILQQFVQIFNEEVEKMIEVLKEECKKPYINVTPIVAQFTLKTIAETAMGTKLKFQSKEETDYKQAVFDITPILIYRATHPWFIFPLLNIFSPWYYRERKLVNTMQRFTKKVIDERDRNFTEADIPTEEDDVYKGKKRLAMLDLLLSAKRKTGIIDDEGIHEEVDTFMFEGHDTTAVALGFIFMLLACHKDCQELILQEMSQVLGDVHKKTTYADLQNMKYLERCLKECLRLYPSVHFILRRTGDVVKTHTGFIIPKDNIVVIHIYDIHRDPKIYPDPEKFDPDRFLPENSQNRHPYAYLPFSAGPRNCIGQRFAMLELKAAVCAVLANFILEPIDTPETIVIVMDMILRTKDGIKIKFIPRVQNLD